MFTGHGQVLCKKALVGNFVGKAVLALLALLAMCYECLNLNLNLNACCKHYNVKVDKAYFQGKLQHQLLGISGTISRPEQEGKRQSRSVTIACSMTDTSKEHTTRRAVAQCLRKQRMDKIWCIKGCLKCSQQRSTE